ncbi:unnamed protein product [Effrenium voratum]|nr:unnamed protein product [Effrenium voratum]
MFQPCFRVSGVLCRPSQAKIADFLRRHRFMDDLDAPKFSCLGFKYTFPLVEAARAEDGLMVLLLIRFGADLYQKNHWGYTAFDYIKSKALRRKAHSLHLKIRLGL